MSMSRAARRTSAVTSSWTWAGARVPCRCLRRLSAWTCHRPSRALAAICGSGSPVLIRGAGGQDLGGHAANRSIMSAW